MLVHSWSRVNWQISVHHPLDAHYDSVMDGTSTELVSSFTLVTKCCKYFPLQEGLALSLIWFFFLQAAHLLAFLWPSLCPQSDGSSHQFLLDFFPPSSV